MAFDPGKPFNDLPLLPPAADIETKPILKLLVSAHKALAELKGLGNSIPNQSMLVNAIPLQEAKASSEIENIITTTDSLYQALALNRDSMDPNTKEVLRYREALWDGVNALNKRPFLTTNLFLQICRTLREADIDIRKQPGTKLVNPATNKVMYTPPEGENLIRNLLGNLEAYINSENHIDPLVKLAVMHYQFEAIHPFSDGNGRTGRIIIILYLLQRGLLEIPVLYLSRYIIENKAGYYEGLRRVTMENAWENWITYILKGIEQTARMTNGKIAEIRNLLDNFTERARDNAPKVYSMELVDILFQHPYCKIALLEKAGIAKRLTAAKYLETLEEIGLLESRKVGREKLFINKELYELLSE